MRAELRHILQDVIDTVRGWGGPEGLRRPPVRDWMHDPFYCWAWPHVRGKVAEAILEAVHHPNEVRADPEAMDALRELYAIALRAGIPVPDGVRALVKGRGGAR